MSQLTRIALLFFLGLTGVTLLHGGLNLRWFESNERDELTVGHLPVT